MQSSASPRWRSWLILVISTVGLLTALGFSLLLILGGGVELLGNALPVANTLPILNLSWASALVALLCIPGLVFSIHELQGRSIL